MENRNLQTNEQTIYSYFPRLKSNIDKKHNEKKKIIKSKKFEQLFLNIGQKNAASVPFACPDCSMTYFRGQSSDELSHQKYHSAVVKGIFIPEKDGEKKVVIDEDNVVVMILYSETKCVIKKRLLEIVEVMRNDLGAVEMESSFLDKCTFFLYLTKRRAVGCAVVGPVKYAFRNNDKDSISVPCICGISRIWVSEKYRRNQIATTILDTVKLKYVYGTQLSNNDIAFSQPTELGKKLAVRYLGENFLVYME
jgi:N-acetyltransferase